MNKANIRQHQRTTFFALAILCSHGALCAATLCVNPGGTNGCYDSIVTAVAAAAANDTINVAAGTYSEYVIIDKPLSIVGENGHTTILEALGLPDGFNIDGLNPTRGISISGQDAKMTIVPRATLPFTGENSDDTALVTIFSNLASKYPKGVYWCCSGYNVMGPNSGAGEQWMAAAFTPDADRTVTKIEVSAGWSEGTNGILISLNNDNNGMPGNALKTWNVSNLPFFGTCCTLLNVFSRQGIPVTGGQQYWVVLSTSASELNTVDAWNVSDADQVDQATIASFTSNAWNVFQAAPGVAFAVKGN